MEAFTQRKIGILTSGGEAPGYNAVIQRVVEACSRMGIRVLGFEKSWEGFEKNNCKELTIGKLGKIAKKPGTVLGSYRNKRIPRDDMPKLAQRFHDVDGFDMLIAVGGDGTTRQAKEFAEAGLKVIVIPSSIDGMPGTYSIGLDSAIQYNVVWAKDHLVYHAMAMNRALVYQVMGRDRNDIAIGVAERTGFPLILSMDDMEKYPAQECIGKVLITSEIVEVDEVSKYFKNLGIDCKVQVAGYPQRVADVTQYDLNMALGMVEETMQAYQHGTYGVLVCYDEGHMVLRPFSEVHY